MRYIKTIESKLDATLKYIFKTDNEFVVEISYINKNDGKDIICLPCQTMCNVGCKFCHTTDYIGKIKANNLTAEEMIESVQYVINNENIVKNNRTLLISFMGCGEPIYNIDNIFETMKTLKNDLEKDGVPYVRFAIATAIPKNKAEEFFRLTFLIHKNKLPVKIHLSLHYTVEPIRKDWMPNSLEIIPSLSAVDFYKKLTGNRVEIHYTLIDGVNDTEQDAILLVNFLKDKGINIKFLFFNEKESLDYHASKTDKLGIFRQYLDKYRIEHEYYIPPGLDIGASCGQFLLDYYELKSEK